MYQQVLREADKTLAHRAGKAVSSLHATRNANDADHVDNISVRVYVGVKSYVLLVNSP